MDLPTLISRKSPIPNLGVFSGICNFYSNVKKNSVSKHWNPYQTSRSVASDLGLHCLSMSNKKGARRIWVNTSHLYAFKAITRYAH